MARQHAVGWGVAAFWVAAPPPQGTKGPSVHPEVQHVVSLQWGGFTAGNSLEPRGGGDGSSTFAIAFLLEGCDGFQIPVWLYLLFIYSFFFPPSLLK